MDPSLDKESTQEFTKKSSIRTKESSSSLIRVQSIGSHHHAKRRRECGGGVSQGEPLAGREAQGGTENTIWGKVVASPEFGPR